MPPLGAKGGAPVAAPTADPTSETAQPAAVVSLADPSAVHPALHHAPISVAEPHRALELTATIDYPNLVKRALVVYRDGAQAQLHEVPFLRGEGEAYVAVIPADDVRPPGLAYAIEIEQVDGTRIPAFGQRAALHDVGVADDLADLRERALLDQLGGRRSVVSSSFDWVGFGDTTATGKDGSSAAVHDRYWRTEAAYTYRPLRAVVEFSIRAGVVRGISPVPGSNPLDEPKVGLNYGAPSVLFRIADSVHLEGELLTSVTEEGFSAGGGAAIHLGEVYGSKLVVGFETIKTFGTRAWARLDLTRARFRVSPIVEVTDMPHADRAGVRLLTEVAFKLDGAWTVIGRGGYQARDFKTGGPGLGLGLAYAF
ncbi:MAG: hypothetical protein NVSMB47_10490 [Polyangiales bacterium]